MATNSRVRSACDACHKMKVRCTGEVPCEICLNSGNLCFYSYSGRLGRPKGTRNNKGRANDGRTSPQSQTDSEKDTMSNLAKRLSPPRSARSVHQQASRQVQPTSQPQVFSVAEDVATGVPLIDSSEYGEMFEIDAFAANYGGSQRPQGQAGQSLDFSNLYFSDGHDQAFLEQSTQVSGPSKPDSHDSPSGPGPNLASQGTSWLTFYTGSDGGRRTSPESNHAHTCQRLSSDST